MVAPQKRGLARCFTGRCSGRCASPSRPPESNRVEEHLLGVRIGLKGLVALACKNRNKCVFRQLMIEFDPPANHFSRCDSDKHILTAVAEIRQRIEHDPAATGKT